MHAAAAAPQHKPPTSCAAAADVDSTEPVPTGCQMELVLAPVSDSPITATVPPSSKWAWCGIDGRSDMQYTVTAAPAADDAAARGAAAPADVYVSVLPGQAAAQHCSALAPSHCRGLYGTTCTGNNCSGAYPGELSGRLKCILVMNAFRKDDVVVTTGVQLQPAGARCSCYIPSSQTRSLFAWFTAYIVPAALFQIQLQPMHGIGA